MQLLVAPLKERTKSAALTASQARCNGGTARRRNTTGSEGSALFSGLIVAFKRVDQHNVATLVMSAFDLGVRGLFPSINKCAFSLHGFTE